MTLASLVCAAVLALGSVGPAEDNPLGFEDPAALADFNAAMEAWQVEDYPMAERLLQSAYEREPKPPLLYSMGQLARVQGDCQGATAKFEAFLETGPSAKSEAEARVNLERCAAELEAAAEDGTAEEEVGEVIAPPPVLPPPDDPPDVGPRRPDALGISLTAVGGALTVTGLALFGSAFAVQGRAQDESDVDPFERGVARARTRYWTGVGLASVGGAVLVGGIVRLIIVHRRGAGRRTAGVRRPGRG